MAFRFSIPVDFPDDDHDIEMLSFQVLLFFEILQLLQENTGQHKPILFRSFSSPNQDIFHDDLSDGMDQNHPSPWFYLRKPALHPNQVQAILEYPELDLPPLQQIELDQCLQFLK